MSSPLLVGGDTLLVLDLGLDILDGVGRLHLKSDGLACEGLHEDLHLGFLIQSYAWINFDFFKILLGFYYIYWKLLITEMINNSNFGEVWSAGVIKKPSPEACFKFRIRVRILIPRCSSLKYSMIKNGKIQLFENIFENFQGLRIPQNVFL